MTRENGEKEVTGEGQTLNGFNRPKGVRNPCFTRNSEYHSAPNCPSRGNLGNGSAPSSACS